MQMSKQYGLIGKKLGHSFSKSYFTKKFNDLNLNFQYDLFELQEFEIEVFLKSTLALGLNVTIPYKTEVLKYVQYQSDEVKIIGASNVLKKTNEGWKAFNSDIIGFENSLLEFLGEQKIDNAIVLGTGGAAKAAIYVLNKLNIQSTFVSSSFQENSITYEALFELDLKNYHLIINTTPLGMFPNIDSFPKIPFDKLSNNHYVFDMIYNPLETEFLKRAKLKGSKIINGLKMLEYQADAAWQIWNS